MNVLTIALGIGAWTAVSALPLYGGGAFAAPSAPQGEERAQKAPPRDPMSPASLHRLAVEYHQKAQRDASLTPAQKLEAIQTALSYEDRALARDQNYVDALVYKNTLLRMKASLIADPDEQARLIQEADELRDKAAVLRPMVPRPPMSSAGNAPPPSPEFQEAVNRLNPLRVGGNIKTPTKVRDVKPEFPAEAKALGVQGVVILETLIDADGTVADARVLRSVPGLDEAALSAVRQWRFTPTLMNGMPTAMLMTVTVNFTLQ